MSLCENNGSNGSTKTTVAHYNTRISYKRNNIYYYNTKSVCLHFYYIVSSTLNILYDLLNYYILNCKKKNRNVLLYFHGFSFMNTYMRSIVSVQTLLFVSLRFLCAGVEKRICLIMFNVKCKIMACGIHKSIALK